MPTYEYECGSCNYRFEEFQSMTAKALTKCPKCKKKIHRLIGGGAGIIFKGSGFYQTDYRSKKYQDAASKDSGNSSNSAAKSDSSESSKPSSETSSNSKSKPKKTK